MWIVRSAPPVLRNIHPPSLRTRVIFRGPPSRNAVTLFSGPVPTLAAPRRSCQDCVMESSGSPVSRRSKSIPPAPTAPAAATTPAAALRLFGLLGAAEPGRGASIASNKIPLAPEAGAPGGHFQVTCRIVIGDLSASEHGVGLDFRRDVHIDTAANRFRDRSAHNHRTMIDQQQRRTRTQRPGN